MKRFLVALAFLASAVGIESPAQAGFITGSQAFVSNATTSVPGNNINNATFTLHFITLPGASNQTGDYATTAGAFTNVLNTAAAGAFVFGNAAYGTFSISSVLANSLIPNISRTVSFAGTFTPGTATFGALALPTPGNLTITINQARRGVLSASATIATSAPPGVPEPSTIVLLGTFCIPAAFGWLRRRRLASVS